MRNGRRQQMNQSDAVGIDSLAIVGARGDDEVDRPSLIALRGGGRTLARRR